MHNAQRQHAQRGGTFLGFIVGLVIGLLVALGVALYVSKVPTPFSNKVQNRTPEQDAVENQKNRDWNPNGVLQPKAPASAPQAVEPGAAAQSEAGQENKPAVQADPLGDLVRAKSGAAAESEPFHYFVQVGAYRSVAEAEAQKAKVAMLGQEARISEREQTGRVVYRVRLGPFDDKTAAERVRARLESAQIESTLVRAQR